MGEAMNRTTLRGLTFPTGNVPWNEDDALTDAIWGQLDYLDAVAEYVTSEHRSELQNGLSDLRTLIDAQLATTTASGRGDDDA